MLYLCHFFSEDELKESNMINATIEKLERRKTPTRNGVETHPFLRKSRKSSQKKWYFSWSRELHRSVSNGEGRLNFRWKEEISDGV